MELSYSAAPSRQSAATLSIPSRLLGNAVATARNDSHGSSDTSSASGSPNTSFGRLLELLIDLIEGHDTHAALLLLRSLASSPAAGAELPVAHSAFKEHISRFVSAQQEILGDHVIGQLRRRVGEPQMLERATGGSFRSSSSSQVAERPCPFRFVGITEAPRQAEPTSVSESFGSVDLYLFRDSFESASSLLANAGDVIRNSFGSTSSLRANDGDMICDSIDCTNPDRIIRDSFESASSLRANAGDVIRNSFGSTSSLRANAGDMIRDSFDSTISRCTNADRIIRDSFGSESSRCANVGDVETSFTPVGVSSADLSMKEEHPQVADVYAEGRDVGNFTPVGVSTTNVPMTEEFPQLLGTKPDPWWMNNHSGRSSGPAREGEPALGTAWTPRRRLRSAMLEERLRLAIVEESFDESNEMDPPSQSTGNLPPAVHPRRARMLPPIGDNRGRD